MRISYELQNMESICSRKVSSASMSEAAPFSSFHPRSHRGTRFCRLRNLLLWMPVSRLRVVVNTFENDSTISTQNLHHKRAQL